MKKMAFCISALLLGSSAYAAPSIMGTDLLLSGNVSGAIGVRDCENTDDDPCGNHNTYSIGGRINVPLGNSFSIQADAAHERYSNPRDSGDQVTGATTYGLHASYRDPNNFLIGIYGGITKSRIDYDPSGRLYGIEGQYYLSRVTLYGQFGKADINDDGNDSRFVGRTYGVGVRYFPTDDIMLQATYAYGSSDSFEDPNDWGRVKDFVLEGKMRLLKQQPLYGFVQMRHSTYTANSEDKGSEQVFMIGASYEFGSPSLYATDRRGATLTTPMLYGRAAGWAEALD